MRPNASFPDPKAWALMVRNYLRAGFGVEDISVKMRKEGVVPCDERVIRRYVQMLRGFGSLAEIYRKGRNESIPKK